MGNCAGLERGPQPLRHCVGSALSTVMHLTARKLHSPYGRAGLPEHQRNFGRQLGYANVEAKTAPTFAQPRLRLRNKLHCQNRNRRLHKIFDTTSQAAVSVQTPRSSSCAKRGRATVDKAAGCLMAETHTNRCSSSSLFSRSNSTLK